MMKPADSVITIVDLIQLEEDGTRLIECYGVDDLIRHATLNTECIYIHYNTATELGITFNQLASTVRMLNPDVRINAIVDEVDRTNMLVKELQCDNNIFSCFNSDNVRISTISKSDFIETTRMTEFKESNNALSGHYVRADVTKLAADEIIHFVNKFFHCNMTHSYDWADLSSVIAKSPDFIWVHEANLKDFASVNELFDIVETFKKINGITKKINIFVTVGPYTHITVVKSLQRAGAIGVVPCRKTFGLQACTDALTNVLKGIEHWPQHIILKCEGAVEKRTATSVDQIKLTARQDEIYKLISIRGLSNKQLARVLHISENTVKIHVSNIMKTLCVRNRTQLALADYDTSADRLHT